MLLNLKLSNFRKVISDEMIFTDGINVIRGVNEASKSTRIEAIAYALFGVKALRTPLEEVVTWGEDVKTLKVELTLTTNGETYVFKRGKTGAEVLRNGNVFVTGQSEASTLASQLLGADGATVTKMMLANQGGIRGALEEGPKALTTLIEDLAGFDLFDRILEAAQEKLALGTPAILEERLKGAEATLEAATQSLPPYPDPEEFEKDLRELRENLNQLEQKIPDLRKERDGWHTLWSELLDQVEKKRKATEELSRVSDLIKSEQCERGRWTPVAERQVDVGRVEQLHFMLKEAETHGQRVGAYRVFQQMPEVERFAGTEEVFNLALDETQARIKAVRGGLEDTDRAIMKARYQRIDHDKCDKCGQDISHLSHVRETNAKVDAELAVLLPRKEEQAEDLRKLEQREDKLLEFRKSARSVHSKLNVLGEYVRIDRTTYPATAFWRGEVPSDAAPDVALAREELAKLEGEIEEINMAIARCKVLDERIAEFEAEAKRWKDTVLRQECPDQAEYDRAYTNYCASEAKLSEIETMVSEYRQQAEVEEQKHKAAMMLWNTANARVQDARKIIEQCKVDLGSLSFNNALVKKLRGLRPVIADKLWNTVLSSVSVMFSQMRREESWVSKGKDGFKCNGQSVESLSGSTLDLLGLALRTTLVKTFVPQCSLLVLDEAAAAMDADRTESMLGFVAGAGFSQTLLITHEEISESIADNLIQL